MIKVKSFSFLSYKLRGKQIDFDYQINFFGKKPLKYTEKIVLPKNPNLKKINPETITQVLQGVHLILGISYYKLYCPEKVEVSYDLSRGQAEFWNMVYQDGLGELYYKNNLDQKKSAKFPFKENVHIKSYRLKESGKVLVGIGGGKDSIVAAELLKDEGAKITGFVVETEKPNKIIPDVIKLLDIDELKIKRFLDPKIFGKFEDSYNGHIPISAVIAFLGELVAVLYGYSYIAIANEYSSNFGNIIYKGRAINHQWSKSGEFEESFQNYTRDFITPSVVYFSALRPFYEIRIVKMFSEYRKYFQHFSSCNMSFRVNEVRPKTLWCGQCPKCAFMYSMLSAFLTKKQLYKIFKKNLFEDETLLQTYADLLGQGTLKPFDCVGTFEESQAAFTLTHKSFRNDYIVKELRPKITNPKEVIKKVFRANPAPAVPTRFRFLGAKNVLIVGYGREGRITHRFLKKYYPKLKIGIADQKFSKEYLSKQNSFDVAIKTPGMPPHMITIPYTTATNLFFLEIKKRGNTIVGVTGSKGKSTTTSLINAILNEGGYRAQLLGNIGIPMLGALLKPISKKTIYTLELSSYQLGEIQFSPNVAVITNLFPEHMDYHGGIEEYYDAKQKIINYQGEKDYFVYNPKNERLVLWAKSARSITVPFAETVPVPDEEIPLLGQHNRENIKATLAAAKIFNISEDAIKEAILKFKPLDHRLQPVGFFKGIKFYDDAISTTPESTIAALRSIPNVKTIFLGGQDRGYNFNELEKVVRELKIENVVLFPESGQRIFSSRRGLNVLETNDMSKAVKFAYQVTPKDSVCLLSTASPSYSVWKDFIEKGNCFQDWVKKLGS